MNKYNTTLVFQIGHLLSLADLNKPANKRKDYIPKNIL